MTAIVGLALDGVVWLAGDRCSAVGDSLIPNARPKVWRSGDVVVGCSGEVSWGAAWRAELPPPGTESGWPDDMLGWLVEHGVQNVRRRLVEWGRVQKRDGADWCDGETLIGHRGCLYEIHGAGDVVQCAEPIAGIGCGANLAIGAATALHRCAPGGPAVVLPLALDIAARFNAYVRAPFDVVSTA